MCLIAVPQAGSLLSGNDALPASLTEPVLVGRSWRLALRQQQHFGTFAANLLMQVTTLRQLAIWQTSCWLQPRLPAVVAAAGAMPFMTTKPATGMGPFLCSCARKAEAPSRGGLAGVQLVSQRLVTRSPAKCRAQQ